MVSGHCVQRELLALGATVPARHGVGSTEPSEQALPGGHAMQPACDSRPVRLPKDPASHSLGLDAPA